MKTSIRPFRHYCIAAAAIAVLCSCDSSTGPDDNHRIGTISFYHDPVVVEAPRDVVRGQTFAVSVRTYGGGCVKQGPTNVAIAGGRAIVTPYDVDTGASLCTTELRLYTHEAMLRFDDTGTMTIAFRGLRQPEGTQIVEERTVVVH
jgi:hypothetical protein